VRRESTAPLGFTVKGGAPGLYLIENDARGERRFHYWRRNSAARRWFELLQDRDEDSLVGAQTAVYLSGISLAHPESIGTRRRNRVTTAVYARMSGASHSTRMFGSPCGKRRKPPPQRSGKRCQSPDIALPSTDDARLLLGVDDSIEQMNRLQGAGVREIALTLGAGGCLVSDGGVCTRLPAPQAASIVDTSGAGDAFNGAYLATRLRGGSAVEAAESGLAVGPVWSLT